MTRNERLLVVLTVALTLVASLAVAIGVADSAGAPIDEPAAGELITAWRVDPPKPEIYLDPPPVPGSCDDWRAEFVEQGASAEEVRFFFDGGIIWRETRCGLDMLNEATGDSGICQINPVHNRSGYFGRVLFGDGGWLGALHRLTTRVAVESTAWVGACLTLYQVCGTRPWQRPYGCANNRLERT